MGKIIIMRTPSRYNTVAAVVIVAYLQFTSSMIFNKSPSPTAAPQVACLARGRALNGCPLSPQSTAGPYTIDDGILRSNITEGFSGVPLQLDIEVFNSSDCEPISFAAVEIWHCDAAGRYSAFGEFYNSTFLRGVQFTNSSGFATFHTIFPGWYGSRTIHIHLRVHTGLNRSTLHIFSNFDGGNTVHTGQLYFDNSIAHSVASLVPYNTFSSDRTQNEDDGIFVREHGETSIVSVTFVNGEDIQFGMHGVATLGIGAETDLSSTAITQHRGFFNYILLYFFFTAFEY